MIDHSELDILSARLEQQSLQSSSVRDTLFAKLAEIFSNILEKSGKLGIEWALPENEEEYDDDQKMAVVITTAYSDMFVIKDCPCPIVGICKEGDTLKYKVKIVQEREQPVETYPVGTDCCIGYRQTMYQDYVCHHGYLTKWIPALLNKLGIDRNADDYKLMARLSAEAENSAQKEAEIEDEIGVKFVQVLGKYLQTRKDNSVDIKITKLNKEQIDALLIVCVDRFGDIFDGGFIKTIVYNDGNLELHLKKKPRSQYEPAYPYFDYVPGPLIFREEDDECRSFYYNLGPVTAYYKLWIEAIEASVV